MKAQAVDAAVKAAKKEGAAAGRKDVMRALHQLHRRRHAGPRSLQAARTR